jgi:hypothetical protein
LAAAIEERQAELVRHEQALDEYMAAMEEGFGARLRVMRRYPDYYADFVGFDLERLLNGPASARDDAPLDAANPEDEHLRALTDQAVGAFFARLHAQRQLTSGTLEPRLSLRSAREARLVSLRDLSGQSGLGEDIFVALEAGLVRFSSEEAVPDELLVELAIGLRIDPALLAPLLLQGADDPQARPFAAVVRESAQTDEVAKARWLRAAEQAVRAAEGEDLDDD